MSDIINRIVALAPREAIELPRSAFEAEFGHGHAGMAALMEVAGDNDCWVTEDGERISVERYPASND